MSPMSQDTRNIPALARKALHDHHQGLITYAKALERLKMLPTCFIVDYIIAQLSFPFQ